MYACTSEKDPAPVSCEESDLRVAIDQVQKVSDCLSKDGGVTATAQGGEGDFAYSVNGVDFQSSGTFSGLAAGNYVLTAQDGNECQVTTSFSIGVEGSTLAISEINVTAAGCDGSNAELTVVATGGEGALTYELNNGAPQASNTFSGLAAGTHNIVVKDAAGCQVFSQKKILHGTSYDLTIKDIIQTNCAIEGCHNGDLGANRNWTVLSNVQKNAETIKTRTSNGSMPPADSGQSLTEEQKDLIACWVEDGALNN